MPKDPFAAVERRYKFRVPELYRSMFDNGHFDPRNKDAWLTLSDFEWLTPEAMAEFEFLDWQAPHKAWFVPFAVSGRHDQWGWRMDWADGGEPPVVFCEWGPEGYAHAPDFRGFLYRMLLEEYSGAWSLENLDDEKGKQTLARSLEIVLPHLPKPWAARLKKLAKKPWQKDDRGTLLCLPSLRVRRDRGRGSGLSPPEREVLAGGAARTHRRSAEGEVRRGQEVQGDEEGGRAGDRRGDGSRQVRFRRQDRPERPARTTAWKWPSAGVRRGRFQMGSPASEPERGDDEDPVQVTLTQGFWLGKFQVTQREYEQLTGTLTGTFTSTGYMKDAVKGLDTSRFPVERMTWNDAVAVCEQLHEAGAQSRAAARELGVSLADRSPVGVRLPRRAPRRPRPSATS